MFVRALPRQGQITDATLNVKFAISTLDMETKIEQMSDGCHGVGASFFQGSCLNSLISRRQRQASKICMTFITQVNIFWRCVKILTPRHLCENPIWLLFLPAHNTHREKTSTIGVFTLVTQRQNFDARVKKSVTLSIGRHVDF